MSLDAPERLLGRQTPTFEYCPDTAMPELGSVGKEAIDLCDMAGIHLDPWQQMKLTRSLLRREDTNYNWFTERDEHLWAAREVAIMLSRQNGKSLLSEGRELTGAILLNEKTIIHSAHQWDTAQESFEHLCMVVEECPDLDRLVARMPRGHGEAGIHFKNGSRIKFRTRTGGGGRGFSADCVVLDEAMYLNGAHMRALRYVLSARPNPQLWYLGSAGEKTSIEWGRIRRRAYRGSDRYLYYSEWAADVCTDLCHPECTEHDDPSSPEIWLKTNPGAGIRITLDTIQSEYEASIDDIPAFCMERLGVGDWPVEDDAWIVIPKGKWTNCRDPRSFITGPFALAVSVSPDRKFTSIAAVGHNEEGLIHGELTGRSDGLDYRPGTQWAVERIKEIWRSQHPEFVVIDKACNAGTFIDALEMEGITIISPTTREYAQACGEWRNMIVPSPGEETEFRHIDQEPLNKALGAADKRPLTGLWAWANAGIDISPVEAITLGAWGFKKHIYTKPAAEPWAAWG